MGLCSVGSCAPGVRQLMCGASRAAGFVAGWIQRGPDAPFGGRATQAVGCLVPLYRSRESRGCPPGRRRPGRAPAASRTLPILDR